MRFAIPALQAYVWTMNAIAFDTHKFVKRLTAAGMPEAQAEVLADEQAKLIDERLATKADLERLATKDDLAAFKVATKADLEKLATKNELGEVKSDIAEVKSDIAEVESDVRLVKWMLALVIVATVIPLIRDLL